jgi:RNA polymerase sigma-70 factor, ECF subfamily
LSVSLLFRAHANALLRAARYLGVRERDVDDVVQEVFIIAHRKWDFTSDAAAPWLFGVLRRVASDHRRLAVHRREVAWHDFSAVVDEAGQATDALHNRRVLLRALDALSDERREVIVFHDLEELPMSEVAGLLGVPVKTAYSRLYAARRDLAAFIAPETLEGGSP